MASTRTRKTVGRAAVGITILAVAAVGLLGYRAAASGRSGTDQYRTVTAVAATVTQQLSLSGTVHHVQESSVSFPASGLVTSVTVKAGDTVTAGEQLASIDTTPLQNAVLAANAAYLAAISQYQTDQQTYASGSATTSTTKAATTAAAPRTSSSASSSGSSTPTGSGSPTPGGGGGGTTDPATAVKAATDALAALQTGIQTIETTLPEFVAQCLPLIPTTTASPQATVTETVTRTVTATVTHTATVTVTAPDPSTTGTATSSSSGTSSTTATSSATQSASSSTSASASTSASSSATATATSDLPAACQTALDTLQASSTTLPDLMTSANLALDAAQKALEAQATALQQQADALAKQAAGASQSSSLANQASAAKQQSSSLASSNSALQAAAAAAVGNAASRTGQTVDAATLITDQATIESSRITLAQAQDQLNNATLVSPIDGKVASMPFTVGQQASASSSVVIIGTGAIEVTVPVPLAKRPQIETNQAATVTSSVDGTTLQGTVTHISLLPTTTGFSLVTSQGSISSLGSSNASSTTTYPTVVTVPSGGDALPEGSRVQVAITTKSVDAKVAVPASALTPTGTDAATVKVLANGILTTKRVVTGAVGDTTVEIVSGLSAGEIVVIADASQPIAAASITRSRASQSAFNGNFQPGQNNGGGFQPGQGGAPPTR